MKKIIEIFVSPKRALVSVLIETEQKRAEDVSERILSDNEYSVLNDSGEYVIFEWDELRQKYYSLCYGGINKFITRNHPDADAVIKRKVSKGSISDIVKIIDHKQSVGEIE